MVSLCMVLHCMVSQGVPYCMVLYCKSGYNLTKNSNKSSCYFDSSRNLSTNTLKKRLRRTKKNVYSTSLLRVMTIYGSTCVQSFWFLRSCFQKSTFQPLHSRDAIFVNGRDENPIALLIWFGAADGNQWVFFEVAIECCDIRCGKLPRSLFDTILVF